jgi:hypothetical protein
MPMLATGGVELEAELSTSLSGFAAAECSWDVASCPASRPRAHGERGGEAGAERKSDGDEVARSASGRSCGLGVNRSGPVAGGNRRVTGTASAASTAARAGGRREQDGARGDNREAREKSAQRQHPCLLALVRPPERRRCQ